MALFDKQTLRTNARSRFGSYTNQSMLKLVENHFSAYSSTKSYDVFLSHAYLDADLIEELYEEMKSHGLTVYVDWIEDKQLDRGKVTPETANIIRQRMRNCKSLIYAFSDNSQNSKWMPWELGYFDALKGKVAVLPIAEAPTGDSFKGSEFLGLYPYIVNGAQLWVHTSQSAYEGFNTWRAR